MQSSEPTNSALIMPESAMNDNQEQGLFGADVSMGWLDVCAVGANSGVRIANTPEAIGKWIARFQPRLVAMEPTGGYERHLCRALGEAGVRWVKLHPNAILAFRQARRVKAKTDAIDAALIAEFLSDALARADLPRSFRVDEKLKALSARRDQLKQMRQAETNRSALIDDTVVKTSVDLVLAALAKSLKAIEDEIGRHIASDKRLDRLSKVLCEVRGVGPVVAAVLMADLQELGCLNAKQIASLVGLAPRTCESGKTKRRATTGHGRPRVRDVLFNAARAAIRHPCELRDFYDRLIEKNGRPKAVAFTAVMRKILIIANAVARDHFKSAPAREADGAHGRVERTPCETKQPSRAVKRSATQREGCRPHMKTFAAPVDEHNFP
jgi:transposase